MLVDTDPFLNDAHKAFRIQTHPQLTVKRSWALLLWVVIVVEGTFYWALFEANQPEKEHLSGPACCEPIHDLSRHGSSRHGSSRHGSSGHGSSVKPVRELPWVPFEEDEAPVVQWIPFQSRFNLEGPSICPPFWALNNGDPCSGNLINPGTPVIWWVSVSLGNWGGLPEVRDT